MTMAEPGSAVGILEAGIDALMRADPAQLAELAEEALRARPPATETERETVRQRRRTLVCLLTLTRRNLRLLGGATASAYGARLG
jgi:hypothetical protein